MPGCRSGPSLPASTTRMQTVTPDSAPFTHSPSTLPAHSLCFSLGSWSTPSWFHTTPIGNHRCVGSLPLLCHLIYLLPASVPGRSNNLGILLKVHWCSCSCAGSRSFPCCEKCLLRSRGSILLSCLSVHTIYNFPLIRTGFVLLFLMTHFIFQLIE